MSQLSYMEKLLDRVEVEWKTLEEVVKIQRGKRLVKSQLETSGNYAVYQNSMTPLGYYHESNVKADKTFIISAGAAGEIGYSDVDFWAADDVYFLLTPDNMESKFLYHFLLLQQYKILAQVRRASIPRLSRTAIEKLQIPIPPLKIQAEIVRILDTFTELTAELTAELVARKQQYAYYREQLLTFEEDKVEWKALGEVAEYSKTRISYELLNEENYVGVNNLLQDKAGKEESSHVPTQGNSTKYQDNDILIGNIRPYLKKIWQADCIGGTNGDVLVIHPTDKAVNPRYLYQVLADDNFFNYNMQHAKGAKMPRGDKARIMEYKIPIPSLAEQQRIVTILDKFEALTTSLTEGLPREIELRQQQYEYYRELLLSFPKAEVAHHD